MPPVNRYALVGGHLLCDGTKQAIKADILIEGNMLRGIGNFRSEPMKYDVSGCLVLPGLINSHAHPGETIFRAFVSFRTLDEYLEQTEAINRLLGAQQELVRSASADMTLLELLGTGTTTVCAGRCKDACETAGMRSFSGYMFMTSQKLRRFITAFEQYFEAYLHTIKMAKLANPLIFLHSLSFSDADVLRLCGETVKRHNFPFTVHVSETENEERSVRKEFGGSSVSTLDQYGLVGPNSLLVHCCYVSEEDIRLIKARSATVVLCPTSNLRLGNQLPPVKKLLGAGVNLVVATDGLITNPSASLINECIVAVDLWPELATLGLSLITINPARALGLAAGKLNVDGLADLIILRLANPSERISLNDLQSAEIRDIIINGGFVRQDGQFLTLEEEKIRAKFEDANMLVKSCIHPD